MKLSVERLKKLGLETAGKKVESVQEFEKKSAIAYEHYRYVSQEKIDTFNKKLKEKTYNKTNYSYDTLAFHKLESYSEVPPENVLDLLEQAQDKKCFDSYEVAKIESKVEKPDPILFGRIKNCPDRFFIGQWDNDIKIEDLLKDNEG